MGANRDRQQLLIDYLLNSYKRETLLKIGKCLSKKQYKQPEALLPQKKSNNHVEHSFLRAHACTQNPAHLIRKTRLTLLAALSGVTALTLPAMAQSPADTRFMTSATENLEGHVTLPIFRGTSGGQTVYYIITEASDATLASQLGVNFAPALANARNTTAVQTVNTTTTSSITFPATVNFGPFPAEGAAGYSPLVQLSNGIILNASHVSNNTGNHDRVLGINTSALTVTIDESDGFQGNQPVRYIVTEATERAVAIAENTTFAPRLANIPSNADANLALMRNGQTGLTNIQRQGEGSEDPSRDADTLNILEVRPGQSGYSPIWEVEPHRWTAARVNAGTNTRQRDYGTVEALEASGAIQDEPVFPGAGDVYVNCPVIARRSDSVNTTFTPILFSLSSTQTNGGGTATIQTTARVQNGLGASMSGVLVTIEFVQFGVRKSISSCVTGSNGTCSASFFTFDPGPITSTVLNLNRKGQSPGVPRSVVINPQFSGPLL